MIDGNPKEFIDKLSYEDNYVLYRGATYFFNGCATKKDSGRNEEVSLSIYRLADSGDIDSIIFDITAPCISECLSAFENATIWDGKSFWDAEQEMTWIDSY